MSANSNISELLIETLTQLVEEKNSFQTRLAQLDKEGQSLSQEEILQLQAKLDHYTHMVESMNSLSKSMSDKIYNLANKNN